MIRSSTHITTVGATIVLMITTNTFLSAPNADLIRRYGHVDYSPLSQDPDFMGNKNDVVELPADILLELALPDAKESHKERRVEFLLDECGEECVIFIYTIFTNK